MTINGAFRVLSIDGGGVRGEFAAHFLRLLETAADRPLGAIFDLIVGTSTGGIIAAAIATGVPAGRVADLYETHAREIFARRHFSFGGLVRARYRSEPLRNQLRQVLGNTTMSSVPGRLILPATDASNGTVFVIKSAYAPEFVRDRDILLVEAVMAACAAPGYFDPVRVKEYLLCDGGLWCNNPGLVGYLEATTKLQIEPTDIRLLSVGTGTGHRYYDPRTFGQSWGLLRGWRGLHLVDTLFNVQSTAAANATQLLLRDQYKRVSFNESGSLPLDDVNSIPALKARAGLVFTHQWRCLREFLQLKEVRPDLYETTTSQPSS